VSDDPAEREQRAQTPALRIGRQRATSRAELSHLALQLFLERGFDATTADDIAAAAGIGRRTLFRYFRSKNDLPWGDFEANLDAMRVFLASLPADLSLIDALGAAVLDFNRLPSEEIPFHRERMRLLLTVPALVAHSTLRYAAWRRVVSDYAAERLGQDPDALEPQAIGWVLLGVSLSAYEQWLKDEQSDLRVLLRSALEILSARFPNLAGRTTPDALPTAS
jgi:mycofactocin system transcriptional regulator